MPAPKRQPAMTAPAPAISEDEAFLAMNEERRLVSQEGIPSENEGLTGKSETTPAGVVTHTRPGVVVMYKPDGRGHYSPRSVPVTAIKQNLESGFKANCPECGGQHGPDPNACPGRDPLAVRVCPVCGKRIYDNMDINPGDGLGDDDDDPNVIHDDAYASSTPQTRTKVLLDTHIWVRHPQSARIMNLPPLARAMADAQGDIERVLG